MCFQVIGIIGSQELEGLEEQNQEAANKLFWSYGHKLQPGV